MDSAGFMGSACWHTSYADRAAFLIRIFRWIVCSIQLDAGLLG